MKELKIPWINWHSQAAAIQNGALAPNDPLRNEPLWITRSPAQDFELEVARAGILRWTNSRFDHSVKDGAISALSGFMRQIFETTTVNLVSSPVANAALAQSTSVRLPVSFFLHSEALLDLLGLGPDITVPEVSAEIYRNILTKYDVRTGDGNFFFRGDTHFVFVVVEPAFEDLVILQGLLSLGVLTRRFALALLMVDFPNPVFSKRRAALARYAPSSARINTSDFVDQFIASISKSAEAATPGSPESDFLSNWSVPDEDLNRTFEGKIERYFSALGNKLATAEGFAPIFEMAESRRREFRKRPLAEFRLTTPITNIREDAPLLELTPECIVRAK